MYVFGVDGGARNMSGQIDMEITGELLMHEPVRLQTYVSYQRDVEEIGYYVSCEEHGSWWLMTNSREQAKAVAETHFFEKHRETNGRGTATRI